MKDDFYDMIILVITHPDPKECACEGTGWIPINDDENIPCPLHESGYKNFTGDELPTLAEEDEALEIWNKGDDKDFINGYIGGNKR